MSVMEDRAKAILRVMIMDAETRGTSDLQGYCITRLADLFHVTPPTVTKTMDIIRQAQKERVLSGGQNFTVEEVVNMAIEIGH